MTGLWLAAIAADFDGHMDWDGGWGVVMLVGMLLFWALVIVAAAWLIREVASSRRHDAGAAPGPLEILDRRLAEGDVTIEEYERRRAALLEARNAS